MLERFKSQLTGENGTENHGRESRKAASTDANSPTEDYASTDTTTRAEPATPTSIELDDVFGVLRNRRRRDVLRRLSEHDAEMQLGELAEKIAARECDKDVSQISSQERKRVYVGLYQCHLPKLADIGVIEYNKPRGIIERGPTFDHVTHYLPDEETQEEEGGDAHSLVESLSNALSTGQKFL